MAFFLLIACTTKEEFGKPEEENFVVIARGLEEGKAEALACLREEGREVMWEDFYILSPEEAERLFDFLPIIKTYDDTRGVYGLPRGKD